MTHGIFNIEEFVPAWQRDLVYVDYRDELSPEQVEKILHEGWDDHLDEWISDAQWQSANELAEDIRQQNPGLLIEEFELAEMIVDLDTSNPYRDLLRNTGTMLFRASPDENDMAMLNDELTSPLLACDALNLHHQFMPIVAEILPEIEGYRAEGGGWFGATFVFSANPADVLDACNTGAHGRIEVSDPFLWLTNPYSGNGWGEVAEGCTVTLQRDDVHVDKYAWGYGAHDVFGGLILPDSKVEGVTNGDIADQ
jgi:hypothetical protein